MEVKLPVELTESISNEVARILEDVLERFDSNSKDLLSVNETKKTFDVSTGTLNKWVSLGLSKFVIDSKVYYSKKEVETFIKSHKI